MPLHHLFNERNYTCADFTSFLDEHEITCDDLTEIFESMASYSGQHTRVDNIGELVEGIDRACFKHVYETLVFRLRHREHAKHCGSKEVFAEEFIPFLIREGIKCVLVLRDPRDAIASMNSGEGEKWTGKVWPTLLNVRNWRKSVAFALRWAGHHNFLWVRYEDIVGSLSDVLEKIARFLGIGEFDKRLFTQGIRDQAGNIWQGNSSYADRAFISPSSIGRYSRELVPEVVRYIEATTFPEMLAMGYKPISRYLDYADVISSFREPYAIERPSIDPDYSVKPDAREWECKRTEMVIEGCDNTADIVPLFLFEQVYKQLHKHVSSRNDQK